MKCLVFLRPDSFPLWCLCPGLTKIGMEGRTKDDLEGRFKTFIFSSLFALSTNVLLCGYFFFFFYICPLYLSAFSSLFASISLCLPSFSVLHSFHSPLPLSFSVLLSHWDSSHVLWRPSEMKPHIGAVAGGRRRRSRFQKKLLALPAKTPARNQTGCGETVKLLKETAAKPQEAKNREGEEILFFSVLQNKQIKMVFVKEFMI